MASPQPAKGTAVVVSSTRPEIASTVRPCELRRRLADEFSIAARLYAEIVVRLTTSHASEAGYVHLQRMTREAQQRSQDAFIAFEQHLESHRCFDGLISTTAT